MPTDERVHATLAAEQRRDVFTSPHRLRVAMHAMMRVAGPHLLAFHLGGDHAHLVLEAPPGSARSLVARVRRSWSAAVGTEFEPPRVRDVAGRRHLERLWPYVARQGQHHGHAYDDALHEGSSVAFALGVAWTPHAWRGPSTLPGWSARRQLDVLGLPGLVVREATNDEVRRAGPWAVERVAMAALLVPPEAGPRHPARVVAGRVVARLLDLAGIPPVAVCAVLEVAPSTLRARMGRDVAPGAVAATLRRLYLEARVRERRLADWLDGEARAAADEARRGAHR